MNVYVKEYKPSNHTRGYMGRETNTKSHLLEEECYHWYRPVTNPVTYKSNILTRYTVEVVAPRL